jgi:hypothetical protein
LLLHVCTLRGVERAEVHADELRVELIHTANSAAMEHASADFVRAANALHDRALRLLEDVKELRHLLHDAVTKKGRAA